MTTPKDRPTCWPALAGANLRRSVLAAELIVEGDVSSSGPVDIQGNVIGAVCAPVVAVSGSGRVEGAIRADDLTVLGVISGDILARQVRLAPSAVVHADVTHDRIVIEPGAELEGRLARKV